MTIFIPLGIHGCLNRTPHHARLSQVLERALAILPDHDDAKLGIKFLTLIERAVDRGGQPAPDPKLSKIRQRVKEMM